MDTAHKQEYKVRDLTTRSVTLFPSRAQVVRELKDVSLKVRFRTPPYPACLAPRCLTASPVQQHTLTHQQ